MFALSLHCKGSNNILYSKYIGCFSLIFNLCYIFKIFLNVCLHIKIGFLQL